MSAPKPPEFAALIGIDWADRKHDICELPLSSRKPKFSVISSTPKSILEWAIQLKSRYPGQKIAVATELKKGPLVYALSSHDQVLVVTLEPSGYAQDIPGREPNSFGLAILPATQFLPNLEVPSGPE